MLTESVSEDVEADDAEVPALPFCPGTPMVPMPPIAPLSPLFMSTAAEPFPVVMSNVPFCISKIFSA